MTKPNSTEIITVLDRSGSMSSIAGDMCGGFDVFVKKQQKQPGECKVTLIQFDDRYELVYAAVDIQEVPALELEPRNSTALLDAIGKSINDTGTRLAALQEEERPSQVLFVIITDGRENASKQFTRNQVFDMISHQKEKYNWEFIFLGANQDAMAIANNLGIDNALTYHATSKGTECLINEISAGVTRYRTRGESRMKNIVDQKDYDASLNK